MLEVWKSFNEYLAVSTTRTGDAATDKDALVTVKFTVTNKAEPPAHDRPEIVFEAVKLAIRRPNQAQIDEDLGQLPPGESVSYELQTRYFDLLDLEYDVRGTVSPSVFMTIRQGGRLPGDSLDY